MLIADEMRNRNFKVSESVVDKIISLNPKYNTVEFEELFYYWHDNRYLIQCYYNLQEKHDCKMISDEEWERIFKNFLKDTICNA